MKPPCLHCETNKASRPRGLCCRCFDNVYIRRRYPIKDNLFARAAEAGDASYTMEELDAIVEQQMQNLPDWWDVETRKVNVPKQEPFAVRNMIRGVPSNRHSVFSGA